MTLYDTYVYWQLYKAYLTLFDYVHFPNNSFEHGYKENTMKNIEAPPLKVAYIIYFLKGFNWPRNKLLIN